MGSPLSPILAGIYKEYFEDLALRSTTLKAILWLRYIDETLIFWPDQEDVQVLLSSSTCAC